MHPQEDESIHAPRAVKVICIGAGVSGLLLAYKLQKHFVHVSLTVSPSAGLWYSKNLICNEIYEKSTEINSTWHENRHPVSC
jgi:cation diffusion facilitator CzcD-associated flavoprotein CzcO